MKFAMLQQLLLMCQLVVQVLALCPAPFTMQSGICVFVNTTQNSTWCSANQQCASIGGELINSYSSVKALINNEISSANCGNCQLWVGLSDLAHERNRSMAGWQRVNGRGDFPEDSTVHHPGEPSGGLSENCLRRSSTSGNKLADANCNRNYGFLCEFMGRSEPPMAGLWKAVAFNRAKYNSAYCFADVPGVLNLVQCTAAAMFAGNSRHVLYNSKLGTCRLLLFTDAQVEQEIETSADWVKFALN